MRGTLACWSRLFAWRGWRLEGSAELPHELVSCGQVGAVHNLLQASAEGAVVTSYGRWVGTPCQASSLCRYAVRILSSGVASQCNLP